MAEINKEIVIRAPLDEIYNYVSKPNNLPQIWIDLIEIKNVKLLPNGGYSYRWKYKMAGIFFTGKGEGINIAPKLWITSKNTGGIYCTITFTFRSIDHRTRVTLAIDYEVHIPILSRIAENTMVKVNDHVAETVLANLRKKFETEPKDI